MTYMKKTIILTGIFLLSATSASAMSVKYLGPPIRANTIPVVSHISTSSAQVSLGHIEYLQALASSTGPMGDIGMITKNGFFEYGETHQVCIAIYPTPAECLPKTTEKGATTTTLTNLKPNTEYFVRYVKDSSIMCIKAPCPTNEWKSEQVEFKTLKISGTSTASSTNDRDNDHRGDNKQKKFKRDLWYRTNGDEVKTLQEILIKLGLLKGDATGFFGNDTLKAVKKYQKDVMHIQPTGKVGSMTRAALHVED